jgi:hypothetical protein
MRNSWYSLDEHKNPIPILDDDPDKFLKLAKYFEPTGNSRRVETTKIKGCIISTVFLVLDHSFNLLDEDNKTSPPVLFETMIFGGTYDGYQRRYCTWAEAEKGHKEVINLLKNMPFWMNVKNIVLVLAAKCKRVFCSP